jgi:hypothetical protein
LADSPMIPVAILSPAWVRRNIGNLAAGALRLP